MALLTGPVKDAVAGTFQFVEVEEAKEERFESGKKKGTDRLLLKQRWFRSKFKDDCRASCRW